MKCTVIVSGRSPSRPCTAYKDRGIVGSNTCAEVPTFFTYGGCNELCGASECNERDDRCVLVGIHFIVGQDAAGGYSAKRIVKCLTVRTARTIEL